MVLPTARRNQAGSCVEMLDQSTGILGGLPPKQCTGKLVQQLVLSGPLDVSTVATAERFAVTPE
ncbi:hypothetical protein GCM10009647_085470 [Streptomyces sanglieri]